MSFKSIENKSLLYASLKYYLSLAFRVFYKLSYEDRSRVEEGEPIIYAPNHQNALIDPLIVAFTRENQTAFFARSDVFKNKYIAKFLYSIKLLPVFRIRDGYENLRKNQEIFDNTMSIIANGNGLVIFPEANHAGYRKLRILKKGISRVAFQTEINYNEKLNVKIVPVGIEYEHYYWFRSKVHISYGEAVLVKDYIEEYKQNAPQGLNSLNNAIKEAIKPLIVDIPFKDEEYDAIDFLTEINFNNENLTEKLSFEDKVKIDKKMVSSIVKFKNLDIDTYEKLVRKTLDYKSKVEKIKTDDYSVQVVFNNKSYWNIYMILFLAFPIFVVGSVFNYFPYKLPYFSTRNITDIQFYSSLFLTVGALLSFPLFYTIYIIIFSYYFGFLSAILIISALGFLGVFSFDYWKLYKKLKRILRVSSSKSKKTDIFRQRKIIVNILDSIT